MKPASQKFFFFILLYFTAATENPVFSQTDFKDLPVITLANNDTSKPMIFYISGDGGWNKFSNTLMKNFNARGYPVLGLNARDYFWKKKDPAQAANDFSVLLNHYLSEWKRKSFILIGYSFGADVSPFIVTRLDTHLESRLDDIVLMSPSPKTDFEIHISGMLGFGNREGQSVPDEINKLKTKLLFVFGSDENDFPMKSLRTSNYKIARLPGGHHYDGNPAAVCKTILDNVMN
jgi:type IV secretory pathway VirJ component